MNEVEITVTTNDKSDFNAIAAKARTSMVKSVKSGLDEVDKTTNARFKQIGEHSAAEFQKSFDPALTKWGDGITDTVEAKVKTEFREVGQRAGREFGDGFTRDASGRLRDSKGKFAADLRKSLSGVESVGADVGTKVANSAGSSLADGFREVGAYGTVILGAVLLASAPIIGAAAATGLVLAFGAGLAGLGLMAAFHLKSVQKEFKGFQKFFSGFMKDIGKPFESTWGQIFKTATSVLKTFQPVLKGAFKDFVAPSVTAFVKNLGVAFKALAPAIRPMAKAFSDLMGAIGPQLPGIFDQMAQALIQLANTVSSNPELFASLVRDALMLVVYGLKLVNVLAQVDKFMNRIAGTKDIFVGFGTIGMTIAFARVLWGLLKDLWGYIKRAWKFTISLVDKVSPIARKVRSAITGIKNKTVHIAQSGASAAVSGVGKVTSAIRRFVGKVVHIGVSGVQGAINLVRNLINIIKKLAGKVVRVGANVFGLGAVRSLIGAIRGVVSKTVNIVAHKFGFAHGGIVGAATGGPRSGTIMVGESGPELVDLPAGSRVRSNPDTRAALAGGGGGDTVRLEVVSGAQDELTKLLVLILRNFVRATKGNGPNSVQAALGG